jgi:hypothetical protein
MCKRAGPQYCHCRHCGRWAKDRRRGLCWKCYEDEEVRLRYRSQSPFGSWADAVEEPTSEEPLPDLSQLSKLDILAARAKRGLPLFEDAVNS